MDYGDMKLGKKVAKYDARTLKLATIFRELPLIPPSYNVDSGLGLTLPTPMLKNDSLGDCVIAGRGHYTLRLEGFEQRKVLPILDSDVTNEYFAESGGQDAGLVMLDSLNKWRQNGWAVSTEIKTKKFLCMTTSRTVTSEVYSIYAYGSVNQLNHNNVKATIYLLNGLYVGVRLPISAQKQNIWDVDNSANGEPGSWGGHCIYIMAYDESYLTCVTWGKFQKMTWAFLDKYCDECFGIVDKKDSWLGANSPVDTEKLDEYLHSVTTA